jgi:calcium permeable stress-gated cation channel
MASSTSTSTQDVLTAIISNGVICAIFVTCFFILRLKFTRVYEPKSYCDILPEDERPEKLPRTPPNWFRALLSKDHAFIIKYSGVDGYLFIRYLAIVASFGLGGMLIWVILFPVNATNGNHETGLDQLSFSNVTEVGRYYAHVFMSWIFYGAIIFTIYRELHFYTNLRTLLLTTPHYAKKLSSRVVIFQTIPDQYLNENEFRKLFGGVKKVWVAKVSPKLSKQVAKRQDLVNTLELQLNKLLIQAMKVKAQMDKKGETIELPNELVSYIPQKKMPTIKETKIIGKKHDLLEYCKENIAKLNIEIADLQLADKTDSTIKPLNTIAVEFENQYFAQLAFQTRVHDQPLHFDPKHIGVEPSDIFWPNMRLFWWEQLGRLAGAVALIIFLIIIWAIPVAFVGLISNLTYLTNKMHWLRFIYNLPDVLLGLITSLLPSVLLAILMMLLPIFIRSMAKLSGCLTVQSIEYFTQQSYFAFQVVQTFLVVTIASSVSSVVTQIVEDPSSALSLLSNNLPKSSNFFISYIILNGFTVSGGTLFQIVNFLIFYAFSFLDKTARQKYNRYNGLGSMAWGTTYPVYEVLAIISIVYSIISPIILLFTFVSFLFLYFTYMNTLNYVMTPGTDMMGRNYPRAMFHLFVGIYMGEICLIGLFAVSKSWGCIVLEVVFTAFTVLCHIQLNIAFDDLLTVLPNSCMRPLDGESETLSWSNPYKDNGRRDGETREEYEERLIEEPFLIEGDRSDINKPGMVMQYLQPWKYLTFHDLKSYIPASYWEYPEGEDDDLLHAHDYDCPDLAAKCPTVWIPRDPMGLSKAQIRQFTGIVPISDENATFDEKGKIVYFGAPPVLDLTVGGANGEAGDGKDYDSFFRVSNDEDVKGHFDKV